MATGCSESNMPSSARVPGPAPPLVAGNPKNGMSTKSRKCTAEVTTDRRHQILHLKKWRTSLNEKYSRLLLHSGTVAKSGNRFAQIRDCAGCFLMVAGEFLELRIPIELPRQFAKCAG